MPLLGQAIVLAMKFDAVVANPPYMGGKGMNAALKGMINKSFPEGKLDIFAAFLLRCFLFGSKSSRIGLMTPFVWMFLNGYELLRKKLLETSSISSLVHPQYHTFFESAAVPICTFVLDKSGCEDVGRFFDLTEVYGADIQPVRLLSAINGHDVSYSYSKSPLSQRLPFVFFLQRNDDTGGDHPLVMNQLVTSYLVASWNVQCICMIRKSLRNGRGDCRRFPSCRSSRFRTKRKRDI